VRVEETGFKGLLLIGPRCYRAVAAAAVGLLLDKLHVSLSSMEAAAGRRHISAEERKRIAENTG